MTTTIQLTEEPVQVSTGSNYVVIQDWYHYLNLYCIMYQMIFPWRLFAIVVKEQTGSNNPIIEYRHLYNTEKHHMCTWKNREIPDWFNE